MIRRLSKEEHKSLLLYLDETQGEDRFDKVFDRHCRQGSAREKHFKDIVPL